MFPIKRFNEIEKKPENFRLVEMIPLISAESGYPFILTDTVGDEIKAVILDVETTGLDFNTESIIELGLVEISLSPSRMKITSINKVASVYEQPENGIPEFISELTGITNEMVNGKRFDENIIAEWFERDPIVIAHNSKFDRPFFDKRFQGLQRLRWACTISGIDWRSLGFEGNKLEYLLLKQGWFYEGHRASIDCLAVAWLLHLQPRGLEMLLTSSEAKEAIVRTIGAPFDVKDSLKANNYIWDDGSGKYKKHWWKKVIEGDLVQEIDFLEGMYRDFGERLIEFLDARERFKG